MHNAVARCYVSNIGASGWDGAVIAVRLYRATHETQEAHQFYRIHEIQETHQKPKRFR